jgi:hypothetical protein
MQSKATELRKIMITMAVMASASAVIPTVTPAQTYTINLAAGGGNPASGNGDGGPATNAVLGGPFDVAADRVGNLYIADTNLIRKVDANGIITTIAGGGTPADGLGDNGPALAAKIQAFAIAVDAAGNIYLSDSTDSRPRIRKVDTKGMITTVAGTGTLGFSGDGGLATKAQISDVPGIAVDAAGNLYLADRSNSPSARWR